MANWACVNCRRELEWRDSWLHCQCGQCYPVFDQIPLLHADARAYLTSARRVLREHHERLSRCDDLWAQVLMARTASHLERVQSVFGETPSISIESELPRWVSIYVSETEFNERVRWAYGPYAKPLYEGHAEGLYASLFRLASQYLVGKRATRALEVGSGEGRNLLEMSKVIDEVVGVDASLTQTHHARAILCGDEPWRFFFRAPTHPQYLVERRFADTYYVEGSIGPFRRSNISLATADATALPFAEGVFDLVVFTNVLNYTSSPAKAIAEARRVLKPEGIMIVGDLFTFSIHEKLDYADHKNVMNNKHDLLDLVAHHELKTEEEFSASYLCRLAEGRDEIWQEQFVVARVS